MAGFAIAREAGQCQECGCRYHPGEMIVHAEGDSFHSDCYRTRGSYDVRPYEDQQPVELDLLLIALTKDVSYAEGEPRAAMTEVQGGAAEELGSEG
ncbi:MAG TPA: hypothetical protein VK009_15860 [Chloroflexota bacterium]|nr:hypothetical protein [Chloroflexota bacterium]